MIIRYVFIALLPFVPIASQANDAENAQLAHIAEELSYLAKQANAQHAKSSDGWQFDYGQLHTDLHLIRSAIQDYLQRQAGSISAPSADYQHYQPK